MTHHHLNIIAVVYYSTFTHYTDFSLPLGLCTVWCVQVYVCTQPPKPWPAEQYPPYPLNTRNILMVLIEIIKTLPARITPSPNEN